MYIKLQGIPPDYEKECIKKLKEHPKVCWLITTSGKYSIHLTFLIRNPVHFYEHYNYVRALFGKYAKEIVTEHAVEGQQFDYPYFKSFKPAPLTTATRVHESKNLSDTDIAILKILTDNSRTSIREIAKKIKSTELTVRSRIKWFEQNEFILKYTALLHPGRTGYFFYIMLIKMDLPNEELEKYIKAIPEIFYFVKGIGPYDFKIEFYVDKESRIFEIEEELYQKFRNVVQHIELLHVKKEHLVRYFVDIKG